MSLHEGSKARISNHPQNPEGGVRGQNLALVIDPVRQPLHARFSDSYEGIVRVGPKSGHIGRARFLNREIFYPTCTIKYTMNGR